MGLSPMVSLEFQLEVPPVAVSLCIECSSMHMFQWYILYGLGQLGSLQQLPWPKIGFGVASERQEHLLVTGPRDYRSGWVGQNLQSTTMARIF